MTSRILLVDDEPGLREAVKAYLEDSEFIVDVASNANQGWDILEKNFPDLVISDIMMPQVDGYQFLKKLREDQRFKNLPVVFLTAKGMTTDRIQGYQAGCDAYLAKPFDPEELVAIVENLLDRRAGLKEVGNTGGEGENNHDLAALASQIAEIKAMLQGKTGIVKNPVAVQLDFTPREQSVLELVTQGLMNKEIARDLNTSVRNVEKYVSRLFAKTGTNSRTELVRFALENGLAK